MRLDAGSDVKLRRNDARSWRRQRSRRPFHSGMTRPSGPVPGCLESPAAQMAWALALGSGIDSAGRPCRSASAAASSGRLSRALKTDAKELPLEQYLELLPKGPETSDVLSAEHRFDLVELLKQHIGVCALRLLEARGDER